MSLGVFVDEGCAIRNKGPRPGTPVEKSLGTRISSLSGLDCYPRLKFRKVLSLPFRVSVFTIDILSRDTPPVEFGEDPTFCWQGPRGHGNGCRWEGTRDLPAEVVVPDQTDKVL